MVTALIFIAVLAVLVLAHEFGHFITARFFGMKVEEFGFGFPPRAIGIRRIAEGATKAWHVVWGNKNVQEEVHSAEQSTGTVYSINWLPLGGFVKIKGEDTASVGANDPDSFASKKAWQKFVVLFAGVFMNIVVSVLLLAVTYTIGVREPVQPGTTATDVALQVMSVLPNLPASAAHITEGATILDVQVEADDVQNPTVQQFQAFMNRHKNDEVFVTFKQGDRIFSEKFHPVIYPDTGSAGIGVGLAEVGLIKYPWYTALYRGLVDTIYYIQAIFVGLFDLVRGLFTGANVGTVSGPVGVAIMTGKVARLGFTYLLQFMAVLSVNLAVLNVLPIPALDGGRILFVLIAAIRRKPVTPRIEQIVHTVGFIALLILVALVTIKDVRGLF